MTSLRLALIDNRPLFRKGICSEIHGHFRKAEIVELDNTIALIASAGKFDPEVIIVGSETGELQVPLKTIELIRRHFRQARIIVLDEMFHAGAFRGYLQAGAHGYLSKSCDTINIVDCLKTIQKGNRYVSTDVLNLLLGRPQFNSYFDIKEVKLTEKQAEIASYLVSGMAVKAISNRLNRSQSTVSTVKATILKKLGVSNVIELKEILSKNPTDD
jgi:DNA-binding NarL/FixJ family response regulator